MRRWILYGLAGAAFGLIVVLSSTLILKEKPEEVQKNSPKINSIPVKYSQKYLGELEERRKFDPPDMDKIFKSFEELENRILEEAIEDAKEVLRDLHRGKRTKV